MGRFDPFVHSAEDEEIRHHIAESVEALVAEGWDPKAARAEAERRFGSVPNVRRELSAIAFFSRLATSLGFFVSDVRYAIRGLWLNRTFTFAVVATLALGIGAASSIFAVVDAAVWRPLPFADVERWVEFVNVLPDGRPGVPGLPRDRLERWREAADPLFDGWVLAQSQSIVRTDGDRAAQVPALAISPGAERLLRIPLLLGRGFGPDDARLGAPAVALLRRPYWEELGADPSVIGTTLSTDAGPVTVVGVLDTEARFPPRWIPNDLWLPLREDFTAHEVQHRAVQFIWMRLPEGVMPQTAQTRADALAASLAEEEAGTDWRVMLRPVAGPRDPEDDAWNVLRMLAGTLAAIYLIALLNGVNLLLVRSSARSRELAVRGSLGASRGRLIRQLLTEALVLGTVGGGVALAVAVLLIQVLFSGPLPDVFGFTTFPISLERRTSAFIFGTSVLAILLLGLIPAIGLGSASTIDATRAATTTDSRRARRARNALVTVQVAVSSALLIGAVLFGTSFARLVRVDPGFQYERLAMAGLNPSPARYADAAARFDLGRRLEERLEALPEIAAVTVTTGTGFRVSPALEAEGVAVRPDQPIILPLMGVGADYFETVGASLVAGRALDDIDRGTENVVVDRGLARFLWSGADPIGRRFRLGPDSAWMTVVGMVEDVKLMGRDDRQTPGKYLRARNPEIPGPFLQIFMRTEGSPELLLPLFERVLWSVDPQQTYGRLRTVEDELAFFEEKPRFLAGLMMMLAGIAVALASVGLYGVLAYAVAKRNREMGIRVALGARAAALRRAVIAEGLGVAAGGMLTGLAIAFALSRHIERSLYAVDPRDPTLFAATAFLLLAVAVLASFIPAQRATRVDPIQVIRAE